MSKCKWCGVKLQENHTCCNNCRGKIPLVKELKRIYREALYQRERERVNNERTGLVVYWE